jgi:hypothetical protein
MKRYESPTTALNKVGRREEQGPSQLRDLRLNISRSRNQADFSREASRIDSMRPSSSSYSRNWKSTHQTIFAQDSGATPKTFQAENRLNHGLLRNFSGVGHLDRLINSPGLDRSDRHIDKYASSRELTNPFVKSLRKGLSKQRSPSNSQHFLQKSNMSDKSHPLDRDGLDEETPQRAYNPITNSGHSLRKFVQQLVSDSISPRVTRKKYFNREEPKPYTAYLYGSGQAAVLPEAPTVYKVSERTVSGGKVRIVDKSDQIHPVELKLFVEKLKLRKISRLAEDRAKQKPILSLNTKLRREALSKQEQRILEVEAELDDHRKERIGARDQRDKSRKPRELELQSLMKRTSK